MAKENAGSAAAAGDGQRLMTLTEVAKRTRMSMPTLQKYKKRYGDRIPSVGKGRTQRYPDESLPVFEQLKKENMARRGRPRKNPAAPGAPPAKRRPGRPRKSSAAPAPAARRRGRPRKAAAPAPAPAPAGGGEGLLTLTQISETAGISYPTLLRYVKLHLKKLPHVGRGRRRRFKPEAVPVFQQLRSESRRGRKPGKAAARRGRPPGTGARRGRPPGSGRAAAGATDSGLAAILQRLEKRLASLEEAVKKPFRLVRG
jgi:DNA-binding transcriptional MerR regulator